MFETHLTVVGRIVTDLRRRIVNNQELISFRVASNSRRRNGEGTWEPGNSLFITVNCWGKLVTGVGAALYKGAPVIVVGDVFTSEYEDKDGLRRSSLEMRATAVGPDLSRAIVRIEQPQPKPAEAPVEEPAPDVADVIDEIDEADEEPEMALSV
ncbi:single-stranded DNA-binding protein [Mycobacterium sp. M26]|uniref:single-stranded DNA-binding protein n=1 Tax=Mycobacterium sp. M26 TaxID=1762962 RepID=UPI00073E598B|nr:single-stranded DNA-binding protein [Mycobacterium sp. M26]